MILVLLGTQNNSFRRLLEEIDKLIEKKIIKEEVIVQSGYTKYDSENMKVFSLIPKEDTWWSRINSFISKKRKESNCYSKIA